MKPSDVLLKRSHFLCAGAATGAALLAGCSGGSAAPSAPTVPSSASPTPTATPSALASSGPTTQAMVTVARNSSAGTIGSGFAGLSYEKNALPTQLFNGNNAALIALFRLLGASVLRIGGNSVDETTWNAGAPGGQTGTIAPADVTALAAFARAANWNVIYGLNLGASTPAAAAAEASFAAQALGPNLYGFEIGNECDLYAGKYRAKTYSVSDFTTEWQTYARAIRDAVPQAALTGPASAGHASTWTTSFASSVGNAIVLLTQHYYRANGADASSTIPYLLAGDPNLPSELKTLQKAVATNAIPNGFRLAEANSYYNGGAPNVSDAYGTALWVLDFLFINALNGSSGVNFHGGGNGPGYTPIANSGQNVVGVRPEFYGLLMFVLAGTGTLRATTIDAGGLNASAYSVARSDGSLAIVISNKDALQTLATTVDLGQTASTVSSTAVLAGPSLDATSGITLGGAPIGADGSWSPAPPKTLASSGTTFEVNVAPASAALLVVR